MTLREGEDPLRKAGSAGTDAGTDLLPAAPAFPSGNSRSDIPHPLASAAAWRPEHPAVVADDRTLSFTDLCDLARRAAAGLEDDGVRPGDVVALAMAAGSAFAVALHAVGWLGAAAMPLPLDLPAPELRARLRTARWALGVGSSETPRGTTALELRPAFPRALPERFWPLAEVRVVVSTSGSTGEPRGIPLRTDQICWSAFGSALRLGHSPADRWLSCVPLHHVGGISVLLRTAIYGTTAVIHRRFEPERVAAALDSGGVTLASMVPAHLARVLDARAERPFPASLRAILVGGAAAPAPLLERVRKLGAPVALTFGMTEAASQVATCDAGTLDGTAGAPLAFARVEADDRSRLWVRGPIVHGGVLETTDLGAIEHGRVRVLGRAGDTINCGGTKIAPARLEEALTTHAGVAEALVVGIPDSDLGEVPAALIVPRPGCEPSERELVEHCAHRLSRAMRPRRVRSVPALPLGPSGKPSRAAARELFDRPQGGDPMIRPDVAEAPSEPEELVLGRLRRASAAGGAGEIASRLEELQGWLAADVAGIESLARDIERDLEPPSTGRDARDTARLAARHLWALPGKRVRPLSVVLAARLGGRPADATVRALAVASELVHAATLLHDDVIDEGDERRGAPSARRIYGNCASVLGGDHLLVRALRLVAGVPLPDVLMRLLGVVDEMVSAESVQLALRLGAPADREAVRDVLRGKTGSLFRWCMQSGALAAGMGAADVERLGEVGMKGGLAFQLADDVLDLSSDTATLGKSALADLRDGKLTWPLLIALEKRPSLAAGLREAAAEPEPGPACAALARAVRETGALDETKRYADALIAEALGELATFPDVPARRALGVVLESLARRSS
jgi:O-succinylbenzoic acid--CoA ligase